MPGKNFEETIDREPGAGKVTTILLTGANGQIGSALRRKWSQDNYQDRFCIVASHRESLDISDPEAVDETLTSVYPDIVVNCAGYTDVCGTPESCEVSWKANSLGPSLLAEGCAKRGILFIHLSCDSIFGADRSRADMLKDSIRLLNLGFQVDVAECEYRETSAAGPLDYLGTTKLAAEQSILHMGLKYPDFKYWIIRTASLFEFPWRTGRSFMWHMAMMLQRHSGEVPAPNDTVMGLCYAPDLADAISWLTEQEYGGPGMPKQLVPSGIYQVSNEGSATWYQVTKKMAEGFGVKTDRVVPVPSQEYRRRYSGIMPPLGNAAAYRVLSTERFRGLGGAPLRPWQEAVESWTAAFSSASSVMA